MCVRYFNRGEGASNKCRSQTGWQRNRDCVFLKRAMRTMGFGAAATKAAASPLCGESLSKQQIKRRSGVDRTNKRKEALGGKRGVCAFGPRLVHVSAEILVTQLNHGTGKKGRYLQPCVFCVDCLDLISFLSCLDRSINRSSYALGPRNHQIGTATGAWVWIHLTVPLSIDRPRAPSQWLSRDPILSIGLVLSQIFGRIFIAQVASQSIRGQGAAWGSPPVAP